MSAGDNQFEVYQETPQVKAFMDCQETVQRIKEEAPRLASECGGSLMPELKRLVNNVVDYWLDVMEYIQQKAKERGGVLYLPDLNESEWQVVLHLVDKVNLFIYGLRQMCKRYRLSL